MMPSPPPSFFYPLVSSTLAGALILKYPGWLHVARGLLLAVLLPALWLFLVAMLAGAASSEGGEVLDTSSLILWLSLSGVSILGGVGRAVVGPWVAWSRRAVIDPRLDFVQVGSRRISRAAVACVRTRKLGMFGERWALELADANGRAVVTFSRFLPSQFGDHSNELARCIGSWLRLPVREERVVLTDLGVPENVLAGLCHLPVQGVFLIVSLFALSYARRPFVRFAATQSLLQFATSLVVLALVLTTLGPLVAFTEGTLQLVFTVLLALGLAGFLLWNVGTHIVACYWSFRGRVWVIPWLSPIVRRWAPPDLRS